MLVESHTLPGIPSRRSPVMSTSATPVGPPSVCHPYFPFPTLIYPFIDNLTSHVGLGTPRIMVFRHREAPYWRRRQPYVGSRSVPPSFSSPSIYPRDDNLTSHVGLGHRESGFSVTAKPRDVDIGNPTSGPVACPLLSFPHYPAALASTS
ncbi:hypothetical protein MTP99_004898 [Tenebrio molitor]|jgi:hypothetical protein|nr:hypothetical protein MTP99_004898 [Tenebrio molitor]